MKLAAPGESGIHEAMNSYIPTANAEQGSFTPANFFA
jgi:hypothetical protein